MAKAFEVAGRTRPSRLLPAFPRAHLPNFRWIRLPTPTRYKKPAIELPVFCNHYTTAVVQCTQLQNIWPVQLPVPFPCQLPVLWSNQTDGSSRRAAAAPQWWAAAARWEAGGNRRATI